MSLPRLPPRRPAGRLEIAAAALAFAAFVVPNTFAAWPPPSYVRPLSEVGLRGGHLGWDGVYVGMTFGEVERTLGRVRPPASEVGILCPLHRTEVEVAGQRLGLDFAGTDEAAVLRAITIALEPRIGETFDTAAVVDALRGRLELAWVPSPHAPAMAEAEMEKPLYRTPSDELVFVNPESGVVIGDVCVD